MYDSPCIKTWPESGNKLFSHLVGDSHQVRTEINVERLVVIDLLLLAKYSSKEFSGCCLQGALAR